MKTGFKKTMAAAALALTGLLPIGQAFAQADSTTGNGALNWRALVPLYSQERETPVVNNTTQVTQNVTQQLISSGMDGAYTNTSGWNGGGAGTWEVASYASCNGGKVVSGGGQCTDFTTSWSRLKSSYPSGNGWVAVCAADGASNGAIYAAAEVVCVP